MCLIWGVPYLLIRVAVEDMSPATVVFLRTGIAALVLAPVAIRRGGLSDLVARWRPLLVYSAIEVALPWWLLTDAERHLSSALAGLLLAAVPLFGILLARIVGPAEAVDRWRILGLVLGAGGVTALVGLQLGHIDVLAVGFVLLTALGYAAGPLVLSRRLADLPAVNVVAASLALSFLPRAPPPPAPRPGRPPPPSHGRRRCRRRPRRRSWRWPWSAPRQRSSSSSPSSPRSGRRGRPSSRSSTRRSRSRSVWPSSASGSPSGWRSVSRSCSPDRCSRPGSARRAADHQQREVVAELAIEERTRRLLRMRRDRVRVLTGA